MKNSCRFAFFPLILLVGLAGCVTGKVLNLPGDLSRPPAKGPKTAPGSPQAAVLDFTWTGSSSSEVGRDFDNVRPIVWKGNPGKAIADLIAGSLAEKGVATVRASGGPEGQGGVPAKVWGRVDDFRANVKRVSTVKVEAEATVTVTVNGSGPNIPSGWSSAITSNYSYTDPLFVTPEGVLQAVNGAANAVADEAASRLIKAGIVAPSLSGKDVK